MKRAALFVGINNYNAPISALNYARQDASGLYDYFVKSPDYTARLVDLMTGDRITVDEIIEKVETMIAQLDAGDLFLFYFSGHGVDDRGSHTLLSSTAREVGQQWLGAISINQLRELTQKPGVQSIFIIDSCRDAVFSGHRGVGIATESAARSVSLAAFKKRAVTGKALPPVILCSCSAGEQAFEVKGLDKSDPAGGVFTKAFLEVLSEPRSFKIDDVVKALTQKIEKILARYHLTGKQTPELIKPMGCSPYLFEPLPTAAPLPSPPPPAPAPIRTPAPPAPEPSAPAPIQMPVPSASELSVPEEIPEEVPLTISEKIVKYLAPVLALCFAVLFSICLFCDFEIPKNDASVYAFWLLLVCVPIGIAIRNGLKIVLRKFPSAQIIVTILLFGLVANLTNVFVRMTAEFYDFPLWKGCAYITFSNFSNGKALRVAAYNGNLDAVRFFYLHYDRYGQDYWLQWAYYDAARNGHTEVVKYLLGRDVDPCVNAYVRGEVSPSLLETVADKGYTETAKVIRAALQSWTQRGYYPGGTSRDAILYDLGYCYANGIGGEENLRTAVGYYEAAAASGNRDAKKALENIIYIP